VTFKTFSPYNDPMQDQQSQRQVFTISDLNRRVRQLLETHLPSLWVEGEISNFACPASGHWYLSLKDPSAQVRCAMFRGANQRVTFRPQNGNQVLVRCRVGLYEGRGDYQLIIEHMEEAGFGALQRQFEQLKKQLSTEGLFDQHHKQSLPQSINHIGLITSATGAAVKDILSVLERRFPAIKVSLFPTAVQGEQAAGQIVAAIDNANHHAQCDALIVGRGGGSLEDLWPFNEEIVARAIFSSAIPIVSAVGHEVDFTIADFVADLRAPTPSAAAELVSPDSQEIQARLAGYNSLLQEAMGRIIAQQQQQLTHLHKRLQHPGNRLQQQTQHLDHLDIRLRRAMATKLERLQTLVRGESQKLGVQNPQLAITSYQHQLAEMHRQMTRSLNQQLHQKKDRVAQTMHLLDAVSPLKTVGRGYAIIRDQQGAVIKTVAAVDSGDQLKGQLADGEILFAVTETNNKGL